MWIASGIIIIENKKSFNRWTTNLSRRGILDDNGQLIDDPDATCFIDYKEGVVTLHNWTSLDLDLFLDTLYEPHLDPAHWAGMVMAQAITFDYLAWNDGGCWLLTPEENHCVNIVEYGEPKLGALPDGEALEVWLRNVWEEFSNDHNLHRNIGIPNTIKALREWLE